MDANIKTNAAAKQFKLGADEAFITYSLPYISISKPSFRYVLIRQSQIATLSALVR
jgi:hypothetical protein